MTADERIEALLNRAGQTLSDLPKRYRQEHRNTAFDAADKFGGSLSMTQNFEDYILHLTDVIDRMETALEYVLGQRFEQRKRLETIADIAFDYDGERTVDGLMALIDEMRDIALGNVPEEVTVDAE